jgi:hypothetical protein
LSAEIIVTASVTNKFVTSFGIEHYLPPTQPNPAAEGRSSAALLNVFAVETRSDAHQRRGSKTFRRQQASPNISSDRSNASAII